MLDLRIPVGGYFLLNGLVLIVAWLIGATPSDQLMSVAVNIWVGVPMIVFGVAMLALARRSKS
ncbi:MAG: hypothetical protein ABI647_05640 [Gemmatimonadota bacterium]